MVFRDRESSSGWIMKATILVSVIILISVVTAVAKEIRQKKQVTDEIDNLKREAKKIEQENSNLTDKINYLQSVDYQNKEARDKLSLQGQGENVVIIKPSPVKEVNNKNESENTTEAVVVVNRSNIEKWWDYFFKY